MKLKRVFIAALILSLLLSCSAPVFALPQAEPAAQPVTLSYERKKEGLLIQLENTPADIVRISLLYSFNSKDSFVESSGGKTWCTEAYVKESVQEELEAVPLFERAADGSVSLQAYSNQEHPLLAYLSGAVNSLYLQISYETKSGLASGEEPQKLEPFFFTNGAALPLPTEPPPLHAYFELDSNSYRLMAKLESFAPDVAKISSSYSWNGTDYLPCGPQWSLSKLGNPDETAKHALENQEIAHSVSEPMKSFLAGEKKDFTIRMDFTTETGAVYHSQPVAFSRSTIKNLPASLRAAPRMGFDVNVAVNLAGQSSSTPLQDEAAGLPEGDLSPNARYSAGQVQVTVLENATWEQILPSLPKELPVQVQLVDRQTAAVTAAGTVMYPVVWKTPTALQLRAGEAKELTDMIEPIVLPVATLIETDIGTYRLTEELRFDGAYDSDSVTLILNPVAKGEKPQVGLAETSDWEGNTYLSLAFDNKPSGATSIKAALLEGEKRSELGELLEKRKLDYNQAHALYGYVPLLGQDTAPYQEWLAAQKKDAKPPQAPVFAIELNIEGGVYAGQKVKLPCWYTYENMPQEVYDPQGMDGSANGLGNGISGDKNEADSESNGSDQRPNLPETGNQTPSVNTPSKEPQPPVNLQPESPQKPAQPPASGTQQQPAPEEEELGLIEIEDFGDMDIIVGGAPPMIAGIGPTEEEMMILNGEDPGEVVLEGELLDDESNPLPESATQGGAETKKEQQKKQAEHDPAGQVGLPQPAEIALLLGGALLLVAGFCATAVGLSMTGGAAASTWMGKLGGSIRKHFARKK